MRRRTRFALLAATIGLVAPIAVNASSASAIDQDLQVSATSGAPGAVIEVSSASCATDENGSTFRYLSVLLVSGTAPDEVLAGVGSAFGDDEGPAKLVVPDWVDPADPAVIEASCIEVSFDDFDDQEPTQTSTPYDPVAFDILAGNGAPVQSRTFSRTSMLAGQAFTVEGSGCFLDGATYGGVDVVAGDDLTGRDLADLISSSQGDDMTGQDFSVDAALHNGGGIIRVSGGSDGSSSVEVEEQPSTVVAGPAVAFSYCGNDDGTLLLYEPQLLDITGVAPVSDIDLTVPAESRTATLAGGSCTAGQVDALMFANSTSDLNGDSGETTFDEPADSAAAAPAAAPAARIANLQAKHGIHTVASGARLGGVAQRSARALPDGYFEATVDPDGSGAWTTSDTVSFDQGFVEGAAVCGDPLADGFLYDTQLAVVDVTPAMTVSTTSSTTTTAVPPAPADAVSGNADYAG